MDTSKTPPSKRKARASLGTAIKRSVQETRKDPGSAGKKRRVVVATQKNIARALNNENSDSNESKIGSSVYEGRITRARKATSDDAPKETPSRMLRRLSKVLPRAERQTPRRNSIRTGARSSPNSTRRSIKRPNNRSKNSVATKKQSPQDLLRQLTRAPGFVRVPQDDPVKIGVSNIDPGEVKSKQGKNLLENMEQPRQNNAQIQQSIEDDEPIDIETQLHDKLDSSDDEIPNYFDQITETMEFTGEVINDRNDMDIEFNDQVKIQPPDEIFNRFRDQEFDGSADKNEIIDALGSPIVGSSRLQEGYELDNFWFGKNLSELNNLAFENNFDGIETNENSERRNRLIDELLRSSLDNRESENYISYDNSLEKQSQPILKSKKYDIENIISLGPLDNEIVNEHGIQPEEPEGNSEHDIHVPIINNDVNYLESEVIVEAKLDDKSYHQPENGMGIIQDEFKEMPQEESVNEPASEIDNDHLSLEQGLNYSQRNKRMRTNKPTEITRLPNSLIKSLFSKFSNFKVSKEAMQEAFDGTQKYFEQISNDLNTYASHAKREVIQEKDVLLLMKRQGLITEKSTFESLVEQYLPRELLDEICPYARAGNAVYPQKKVAKKRNGKASTA